MLETQRLSRRLHCSRMMAEMELRIVSWRRENKAYIFVFREPVNHALGKGFDANRKVCRQRNQDFFGE